MRVAYEDHPGGIRFTESTVRTVARLAKEHAGTWPIRKMATSAVQLARVPDKDTRGELAALYDFVTRRVRYTRDPIGLEWVQNPARTLAEGVGDCDDIACALGSLAQSIGIPVRYAIGGPAPGRYSHIWAEGRDRQTWIPVDPVMRPRQGFGDRPLAGDVRFYDDQGGRVMAHMNGIQLAGPVNAAAATLWETSPLFNSWDLSGLPHHSEIEDPDDGDLALGDDGEILRYDGLGGFWNTLKSIGKAVTSVAKFIPIPGVAQIAALAEKGLNLIPASGKVNAAALARGAAGLIPGQAGQIARAATGALAPALAARTPAAAAAALAARAPSAGAPRAMVQASPSGGAQVVVRPATPSAAAAARVTSAQRTPHPELARRYPPDARQLFDAGAQLFRVYLPSASGALALGDDPIALAAAAAIGAIKVASAAARRRMIPALFTFQKMVPGLSNNADGLYGPNSRAALAWAAPSMAAQLPPAAFPGTATWQPVSQTPATPPPAAPSTRTAAPAGGAPRAAVYRDTSGTPRVTGYAEVAQHPENPGLAPVGFQPPPPETRTAPPPPQAPGALPPATDASVNWDNARAPAADPSSYAPRSSAGSSSGGMDGKTIALAALLFYALKRRRA